ncbi:U32 family peptidase [Chloroflexota bacterium]
MVTSQRKWIVPAFWDESYLKELDDKGLSPHIYEFYGSLPGSFLGTMLTRASLPGVTPDGIKDFIKQAHSRGIRFSYTLNALAMGNREYTAEGREDILKFLGWLRDIEADSVIVANPLLAMLIRENFPSLEIGVSSAAGVDSLRKAGFWEAMEAASIKLPLSVNRNFPLLKSLAGNTEADMEVMVNQLCLYQCPMERYHTVTTNTNSQAGRTEKKSPSFLDWCRLQCNITRWSQPAELLKSPIVRPEDIPLYQQRGVRYFKIIGRNKNMRHQIVTAIEAYAAGSWRGNLLDIVGVNANPPPYELREIYPESEFQRYFTEPLYDIDNAKLDGFIGHFIKNGHKCAYSCGVCRYCDEVAQKVITVPSEKRLAEFLDALTRLERAPARRRNNPAN